MAKVVCPDCGRNVGFGTFECPMCKRGLIGVQFRALPLFFKGIVIACGVVFALFAGLVVLAVTLPDKPKPQSPSPQAAVKTAPSGPPTVQPGQWFGFRNREMLERATKIATQGDKAAWAQLMSQAAASGAIVPLKPGEEVFLEDTALLAGLVKIRRKGEVSSWWTNMEAVK